MTHRVWPAVALTVLSAACAARHPVALGATRPPGTHPAAVSTAPPTTVTVTGNGPAAIAARFTLAYFDTQPGEAPGARRQRCRPLDTDSLDQLLAVPTWNGAANAAAADQTATATIDSLNLVDTADQAAGYELTVTVTAVPAADQVGSDERDVQLWLTSQPGEGWRVAQVSVT